MHRQRTLIREEGNILILSVVMLALLIASGMGYMKWAADERWDSAYEEATVQAYFLAQSGLIEKGLQYLRTREPGDLPQGTVHLTPGIVPGVGSYMNAYIRRVTAGHAVRQGTFERLHWDSQETGILRTCLNQHGSIRRTSGKSIL
jgi:hypothetical protein